MTEPAGYQRCTVTKHGPEPGEEWTFLQELLRKMADLLFCYLIRNKDIQDIVVRDEAHREITQKYTKEERNQ